jgi:two-component system, NtrC family, sensor kinase
MLSRDKILSLLVELASGRCSISEADIARETDSHSRKILLSMFFLAQEINVRRHHIDELVKREQITQKHLLHNSKLSVLGSMLASTIHELKNPLASIQGYLTILMSEDNNKLPEQESKDYLDKINKSASRMLDLTQKVTRFARKEDLEAKTLLQVNELVANSFELMAPDLQKRQIAWDISCPEGLVILGQKVNLEGCFINLIANSRDAFDDLATSADKSITLTCQREGNSVQIIYKDNAGGMPAAVASKIFQPFFTTKTAGKGTGLGLSICYSVIKEHGGDILLHTEEGKGTEFTIILPLHEPSS